MHSATVEPGGLQRLEARLRDLGDLGPGQRFLVPGIGRSGRVLGFDADGDDDGQILVELEGSRARLRASLRVQPQPDPPADKAA